MQGDVIGLLWDRSAGGRLEVPSSGQSLSCALIHFVLESCTVLNADSGSSVPAQVFKNGQRLGVMQEVGLCGEYRWCVALFNPGDTAQIEAKDAPTDLHEHYQAEEGEEQEDEDSEDE